MNYREFYEKMKNLRLISDSRRNLLTLLNGEIADCEDADTAMELFILYFSLVDDGSTYMPLDTGKIKDIFDGKIDKRKTALSEEADDDPRLSRQRDEDKRTLDALKTEIEAAAEKSGILENLSVVGADRLFIIDKNRLFARKYYNAAESIKKSADRLLKSGSRADTLPFDFGDVTNLNLKNGQREVIEQGINKNLLVTGGPGTGKTTSIFYLLLAVLCGGEDYNIYLTAPSGKAAVRMSESIGDEIKNLREPFASDKKDIIDKISKSDGRTIHRLLETDRSTGRFVHTAENKFPQNSIFVIDEASMIDVCLFASLFEAIPDGARVFILGDKNQLPSVECGAVYGELLEKYTDNVIELTETNRFSADSEIFRLSELINRGGLRIDENLFNPIENFEIEDTARDKIFYYADNRNSNREIVEIITEKWYKKYYDGFMKECTDIENDPGKFGEIIDRAEKTKILCALKETTRGADHINKVILDSYCKGRKISGYYPGELLMITKNLKALDLYNGDCGVTVKFKDDGNLYFMIRKAETGNLRPIDEKTENRIFRLGDYFFYPVGMIGREDISSAFAITVHKAQGSGYDDVFVILPKSEGHPLLNRQLVYTAITRTKKNTYIITNKKNLEDSSNNRITRQTGIYG